MAVPMGCAIRTVIRRINAIRAASQPQTFLGINLGGAASAVVTAGNPNCHIVLRGGSSGPNYSAAHLLATERLLDAAGLIKSILVDCSHDNSSKKPERQPEVMRDLLAQIAAGNTSIVGLMLESNLFPDNQKLNGRLADLKYGISITDGCIGWDETQSLILDAYRRLGEART